MKKTVLIIIILTVFSKLVGFFRDIILSYFYGASNITDVYLISLTIPGVILGFIGTAITTGYIPMYSSIENNQGANKGNEYTNNIIHILLIICTFIFLGGVFCAKPLVQLFAFGFTGDTLKLAVLFTRISLLGIYFTVLIFCEIFVKRLDKATEKTKIETNDKFKKILSEVVDINKLI